MSREHEISWQSGAQLQWCACHQHWKHAAYLVQECSAAPLLIQRYAVPAGSSSQLAVASAVSKLQLAVAKAQPEVARDLAPAAVKLAGQLHLAWRAGSSATSTSAGAMSASGNSSSSNAAAPSAAAQGGAESLQVDCFMLLLAQLMRSCSADTALQALAAISNAAVGQYMWPAAAAGSAQAGDGSSSSLARLCQVAEVVLAQEAPEVVAALQAGGVPPACLCAAWLQRSWLGVLPLADAVLCAVVLPVLLGPDYAVYLCVALLLQHREQLLQASRSGEVPVVLASLVPGKLCGAMGSAAEGAGDEDSGWAGLAGMLPQLQALERRHRPLVLGMLFSE